MQILEDLLENEKLDGIQSLDIWLEPISKQLVEANWNLGGKSNGRVQKGRKILELMADEVNKTEDFEKLE